MTEIGSKYFLPDGNLYSLQRCDECGELYYKWENCHFLPSKNPGREKALEKIKKWASPLIEELQSCECERDDKEPTE